MLYDHYEDIQKVEGVLQFLTSHGLSVGWFMHELLKHADPFNGFFDNKEVVTK